MDKLITLRKILEDIEQFEWSDALFLPEDETWDLDTRGAVMDPDEVEDDSDEVPEFARDNNLMYTLDIQTIKGIVKNALAQKTESTDEDLIESFLYYYDHDAFMEIK
jgi:hypothetical protein